MMVLVATEQQKHELNGFENGNSKLEFVLDSNNEWICSESVLSDKDFEPIIDRLLKLNKKQFTDNI
jgi:hypothetical protein